MAEALVFDFDGLILDTETPLFEAWSSTYEHFGLEPIDLTTWRSSVGLHDADPLRLDPLRQLLDHLGGAMSAADIEIYRRNLRDQGLEDADLMPGVVDLLDAAEEVGLRLGIATSSPMEWIHRHLEPRGILDRFDVIACAGGGLPGKPHPATYEKACRDLGVDPSKTIAFEDSPNGTTAAVSAGLHCIAVPNLITADCDFDHAHHVVPSLAQVDLRSEHPRGAATGDAIRLCPLC